MTKSRSSTGEASIVSISFTLVIIFLCQCRSLLGCSQCRLSGLESLLSGLISLRRYPDLPRFARVGN